MTAVLAPRFLASAFSAGPALLLILIFIVRKISTFDPGKEAIQKLAVIITYAMVINVFLIGMELFTTFYSNMPEHMHHFQFLYIGSHGNHTMVPWMWTSAVLSIIALVLLIVPKFRANERILGFACISVFVALWIDKGLGMMVAGFTPSPMGQATHYWPTLYEVGVTLGVYGIGALIIAVLFKIVLSVRDQLPENE